MISFLLPTTLPKVKVTVVTPAPAPAVVAVSQSRDDTGLRTSPVKPPPLSREVMTRRFVQYHNELLRRRRWQQQVLQQQRQGSGLLSDMFRSFTDMFG